MNFDSKKEHTLAESVLIQEPTSPDRIIPEEIGSVHHPIIPTDDDVGALKLAPHLFKKPYELIFGRGSSDEFLANETPDPDHVPTNHPTKEALAYLLSHPEKRHQFDEAHGTGASDWVFDNKRQLDLS